MEGNDLLSILWNKKRIHLCNLKNIDYSFLNPEIKNPRQIVWHLINQIDEIPDCLKCSNKVSWNQSKYNNYCSSKCSSNSKETKEKQKQTNLKKYGIIKPLQLNSIKEKYKKTNLKNHGVENPSQSKNIQDKIKKNNLKKYGFKHTQQLEKTKEKYKKTNLKRYNVKNYNQKNFSKKVKEIIFDKENFNNFMKDRTVKIAGEKLNIDINTVMSYIKKYNTKYLKSRSSFELEIEKVLKENNILYEQNTRQVISPKELDFYLPNYNLAIECNGDYWHSDKIILEKYGLLADDYHQQKTKLCKEKGIKLLHISENSWNKDKEKIIKNILCELKKEDI